MAQITLFKDKDGTQLLPQTSYEAILDKDKLGSAEDIEELIEKDGDLQKAINDINANNTSWTAWQSVGVNLLNGAQISVDTNDYPQYRSRKVGGSTQVEMAFSIKNVIAANDTAYVSFPTSLVPVMVSKQSFVFAMDSGKTASWIIDSNGNIKLRGNSAGTYNASDNYQVFMKWEVVPNV